MATFHLELVAPDKLTFSGEVDQVDVPGLEGDFGVLPITRRQCRCCVRAFSPSMPVARRQKFVVLGGFAEVSAQGALTVLAEVAATLEDFDRAALAARIAEMEENVKAMEQARCSTAKSRSSITTGRSISTCRARRCTNRSHSLDPLQRIEFRSCIAIAKFLLIPPPLIVKRKSVANCRRLAAFCACYGLVRPHRTAAHEAQDRRHPCRRRCRL